ncbi:MAG: DnaJ domain-containing protein [Actinobacteria bacterium]|nr:DnaJ domain-containing protein [Actinomycetota bacterium]
MAPQREWFEKDYYAVLGVPLTASEKDIARAYRKLAKQYHPDANPGDKEAEERFKDVSAAYEVLDDPERRKEYDQVREMVASGVAGPGFGRPGSGPGGFGDGRTIFVDDVGDLGDFGDIFGGLFGRGGRGGGRRARADMPMRGPDYETEITLDFMEAVHGVMRELSFDDRNVKVRIPPGVADGQRIRVKGRGGPGENGGPPGDLYVVVRVRPHPIFGRKGDDDLTVTVPITFAEAALGGTARVPTLTEPVTVKIPPGTQSGKTVRVRGRGIEKTKGSPGDLLVTFEVVVPEKLSEAERKAVAALGDTLKANPREHLGV